MNACACRGGRSRTQGPIRERESAPEVLLERRECVKVVRREWKAALKFIAGGLGGRDGGGIGGGGSGCLNTDQPSCSSNTLKILRTGVRRRRLRGSERRVERSGRSLMRLRKAAVAPAPHLEIGRRRVRGFLFMSARRVTECVCHSVTRKKENSHPPQRSCCAPPAVRPSQLAGNALDSRY